MSLRRFSLFLLLGLSLVVILIFIWFYAGRVEPIFHAAEMDAGRVNAANLRQAFVHQHDNMIVRLRSMGRWAFEREYLALDVAAKYEWERRRLGSAQPAGRSFDMIFFLDGQGAVRYARAFDPETGRHEYAPSSVMLRVRAEAPSLFADLERELLGFSRIRGRAAIIAAAPVRENTDNSFLGRIVGIEFLDRAKVERIVGPIEGKIDIVPADEDPRAAKWAGQVDADGLAVLFDDRDEYAVVYMPRGLDGDRPFAVCQAGGRELAFVSRGMFRLLLALMIGFLCVFGASLAGFLALAVEGPARRLRLAAVRARGAAPGRRAIPAEKIAPFHGLSMAMDHLAADLDLVDRERLHLLADKELTDRILGFLENGVSAYVSGDRRRLAGMVEAVTCFPEVDLVFFYGLVPDGTMRTCGLCRPVGARSTSRVDLRGEPVGWVRRLAGEEGFRLFSLDGEISPEYEMVAGIMREYNLARLLCLPIVTAKAGSGVLMVGGISKNYRLPVEEDRLALGLMGKLMATAAATEAGGMGRPSDDGDFSL